MKKLIISSLAVLLFLALVITTVWYHDLYKKEQEKVAAANVEINKLTRVVEANKSNNSETLAKTANKFITFLFENDNNHALSHKKALLSMTTGEAYRRLTESKNESDKANTSLVEGFKSEAVVKNAVYNKISLTKGKVIVVFEHLLTKDGTTTKTLNQAEVHM
ncbi:hypothetical protein, partial [Bacillus xiapuensis]|nr:hypothetical protein [Bacillus xiapuensis]